jgi:hypothetical protein
MQRLNLPAATALLCLLSVATINANAQDATQPPSNEHPVLTLEGRGVQIYACQPPVSGNAAPQWTFVAPAARLFDGENEVGTHGDGPVWQYQDGSSIHGQLAAKSTPDATAIPWLLLKGISPGRPGVLAKVEYIRRSNTKGGLAPTTGCDKDHALTLAQVPYTATYTFYSSK